jgi:D-alanyl-D-alanine dipeptidase
MIKSLFPVKVVVWLFSFAVLCTGCTFQNENTRPSLPTGFVYLKDVVPSVVLDIRYYGEDNFVGTRVNGYHDSVCIISETAAKAMKKVSDELVIQNLRLKVFDAYRPQKAVDHFSRWAKDLNDVKTKLKFYPNVNKSDLFKLNYIASKSGHSRGSTVDLTLIDENGDELDMGTTWDYFGPKSWPSDTTISLLAQSNRKLLQKVMLKNGFVPYSEEWWHFTLEGEPFPDAYFDFDVE